MATLEGKGARAINEERSASRFSSLTEEQKEKIIVDIMQGSYYRKGDPKDYLNKRKFTREQAVNLFNYMLTGQAGDLFEALQSEAEDAHLDKMPIR